MTIEKALSEQVLPDDYPVYAGYAYVADGKPVTAWISGNVAALKRKTGASEIKNCDLYGRGLL